jgi:hypothetical protein
MAAGGTEERGFFAAHDSSGAVQHDGVISVFDLDGQHSTPLGKRQKIPVEDGPGL